VELWIPQIVVEGLLYSPTDFLRRMLEQSGCTTFEV